MNRSKISTLATLCAMAALALVLSPSDASAITKDDNTTALQLGGSWIGGVAPVSTDIADWSGTYNTAGSLSATYGANLSWQGITIGNIGGTAAGLVSVGGTGGAPAFSLTVGSSGVDMSAANQNLVLNANFFNFNTSQTWNIASGRNLRLGKSGTGSANADVDGSSATAVITIAGGGVVDLNQGGGLGFADAGGYANFQGKWKIDSGATLRGIRNGATAFGTNTSADAINLNGGTLAVGGISGTQGNWTWQTPMTLSTGTTSSIDQQIPAGGGRSLILRGVITGTGANTNLIFKETGANNAFDNDNLGYIIAGNNSLTSDVTVTIGGATENGIGGRLSSVRLGGDATANATGTGAGTAGSFGSAAIINNGVLTLSHSNAWTLGNTISGSGSVRVGFVSGTSGAQVVTVSGPNSYAGGTSLDTGNTLNINHATAIGSGTLTISGNGTFDNTSGGAITLTNNNPLTMSGGSPTFTGSNDLNFGTGAVTISGAATRTITVTNAPATLTLGGAVGQDIAGRNFAKAGLGKLILGGANTYSGTTSVSAGTLLLNGSHTVGGDYTISGAGTFGGTGSTLSTLNVSGTLAPGASIESLGSGILNLNNGSTFDYELRSDGSFNGDLQYVTGGVNLAGTVTLNLTDTNPGTLAPGSKLTLISSTGAWNSGLFTYLGNALLDDSTFTLGANTWVFNYNDTSGGTNFFSDQTGATNFVTMTVVPEPSTFVMLLFGSVLLWVVRRKRN